MLQEEHSSLREGNELHLLYRTLPQPEAMLNKTQEILLTNVDVNEVDKFGNTALSYLVLHINRGLRYHAYTIPKIQSLVDSNATNEEIEASCIELDAQYQHQVYACLELLISKGSQVNYVPAKCPSIAHDLEWTKAYENKLLQQDGRWHLFDRGLKMDYTKFNFFDPVTVGKVENTKKLSVLHLTAWRGNAKCLALLLNHGADVDYRATDGRNALHFLYQYCNKPMDLPQATSALVAGGIFTGATDSFGQVPFQSLLKHSLITRSYVKYLANAYSSEFCIQELSQDNYRTEVKQCIQLLLDAGQDINHHDKSKDNCLHILLHHFATSLEDAEVDFQVRRHYLVPYRFQLAPVTDMIEFLLDRGCQVDDRNGYEKTALHFIVQLLANLLFHDELNSVDDVKHCLAVLFRFKADLNLELNYNQTTAHIMAQVIQSTPTQIDQYTVILEELINHGLDLNAVDRFGKAILHYLMQSRTTLLFDKAQLERLLVLLLRSGADANREAEARQLAGQYQFVEIERKYPLTLLLRSHSTHHSLMDTVPDTRNMDAYLNAVDILSQCMCTAALQRVFYQYCDIGVYGVFCGNQCPVFQVLYVNTTEPRKLSHVCRLAIWKCAGRHLNNRCDELPLPTDIKKFIKWST